MDLFYFTLITIIDGYYNSRELYIVTAELATYIMCCRFIGAVVTHVLEGYYAYHLAVYVSVCSKMYNVTIISYRLLNLSTTDVIKWTVQTALYGFPSLYIIRKKYIEDIKYK